jgi:hypothetical protein
MQEDHPGGTIGESSVSPRQKLLRFFGGSVEFPSDEAYLGVYEASTSPFSRPGPIADRAVRFFQRTLPRPNTLRTVRLRVSRAVNRDLVAEVAAGEAQHRTPDAKVLRAVEQHAMAEAKRELRDLGWKTIKDVSRTCSFDFYCTAKGRRPLRVEVKGTVGDGESIPLTANEIRVALSKRTALAVVHSVRLTTSPKGKLRASGGILEMTNPWKPAKAELEARAHLWWRSAKPPRRAPRDI